MPLLWLRMTVLSILARISHRFEGTKFGSALEFLITKQHVIKFVIMLGFGSEIVDSARPKAATRRFFVYDFRSILRLFGFGCFLRSAVLQIAIHPQIILTRDRTACLLVGDQRPIVWSFWGHEQSPLLDFFLPWIDQTKF